MDSIYNGWTLEVMANWTLRCQACEKVHPHTVCSMFNLPPCPDCGGEQLIAIGRNNPNDQHPLFPFTVPHVDGKPMLIENMAHLRSVEKQYGVAFSAFNKDNIHDLDPLKDVPKYIEQTRKR